MAGSDVRYETREGAAWITIDRPEVRNALRARTARELLAAFRRAGDAPEVGVIVLTGAGDKAFCAGRDMAAGETEDPKDLLAPLAELHAAIRGVPQPVVAAVNGAAMGGGHVLHLLADLSIASETARFGLAGPKVGGVDAGWGTAYLARVVGEKRAREMWYLCRVYTAAEALAMGLVNAVVPPGRLRAEVEAWCAELLARSPTALAMAKQSFNADTASIQGIAHLGFTALDLFLGTEESKEGARAFREKRAPDFARFRKRTK